MANQALHSEREAVNEADQAKPPPHSNVGAPDELLPSCPTPKDLLELFTTWLLLKGWRIQVREKREMGQGLQGWFDSQRLG